MKNHYLREKEKNEMVILIEKELTDFSNEEEIKKTR